jgi:phosphatidylglycerol:prolipoprotein diacylglycerol transferase
LIPVLLFPAFNPVALQLGPLAIRWYALAYIAGLVLGWRLLRRLVVLPPAVATPLQCDDFLTWATLGVVLGGRLGYVLFYQPSHYLHDLPGVFALWQGGMSFHGGSLGMTLAIIWFTRRQHIPLLGFADRIAVCVPIGLGLGRVANFIKPELWGRPAPDWLPWAMIFPPPLTGDTLPRHPSQLYEALLEGVVLFAILTTLAQLAALRARPGFLCGAFLTGYGIARVIAEMFREPDAFLGFLWGGATMGQVLSIPMVLAGAWLMLRARPRPLHAAPEGAAREA